MTCLNLGVIGTVVDRATPAVVRESDSFIVVQMTYKGTSTPYSFQTLVGATGFFPGTGGLVEVAATLVSADLGKLRFNLAASGTALMSAGEEQNFQVDFEDDDGLWKILLESALRVVDPLYPA